MSPPAPGEAPLPVSYAAILGAISTEIANTLDLVSCVETAICRVAETASLGSEAVADLQQLDRVLQQLAALRDFTSGVSADADRCSGVQIGEHLQRITLQDVRSRIAGELAEAIAPAGTWEEF